MSNQSLMTVFDDSNTPALTPQQREAAAYLGYGLSVTEAARKVGIDRTTIYTWKKIPGFCDLVEQSRLDTLTTIRSAHLGTAIKLQEIAVGLIERYAKAEINPKSVADIAHIAGALKTAQDLQRQALGIKGVDAPQQSINVQANAYAGVHVEFPIRPMREFISQDLDMDPKQFYPRVMWLLELIDRTSVRTAWMMMGKGSGKTVLAETMLKRSLQRVLAMPNPQRHWPNIMDGTKIGAVNLSGGGKQQAQLAIFGGLKEAVNRKEGWFAKYAQANTTGDLIEFPKGVVAMCGNSQSKEFEGIAVFAAAGDEVCRLPEADHAGAISADNLVGPVLQTMISRFPHDHKMIVMSWPEHRNDYLHKQFEQRLKTEGLEEDLTDQFLASPLTHDGPEADAARKELFREDPFNGIPVSIKLTKAGSLLVKIPVWQINPYTDLNSLKLVHAQDKPKFYKMHAANPMLLSSNPYLYDIDAIRRAANTKRQHPLDEDNRPLPWFVGSPNFLYYGHIDLGVTQDACGVAIAHYEEGRVVYDLLLEIVPTEHSRIRIASVRELFYSLAQRGFTFGMITFDQFEGQSQREGFEEHGLRCDVLSVDRTRHPYDEWRGRLLDGRLDYYDYEPLYQCCGDLMDMGRKVDHREGGKKDLTDAMAAALYNILTDQLHMEKV